MRRLVLFLMKFIHGVVSVFLAGVINTFTVLDTVWFGLSFKEKTTILDLRDSAFEIRSFPEKISGVKLHARLISIDVHRKLIVFCYRNQTEFLFIE